MNNRIGIELEKRKEQEAIRAEEAKSKTREIMD